MKSYPLAKWHTLYLNIEWAKLPKAGVCYNYSMSRFYKWVVYYILKTDLGFSRITTKSCFTIRMLCGDKKLNKVVKELDILGLADCAIIF